jgi:hypothetical protein
MLRSIGGLTVSTSEIFFRGLSSKEPIVLGIFVCSSSPICCQYYMTFSLSLTMLTNKHGWLSLASFFRIFLKFASKPLAYSKKERLMSIQLAKIKQSLFCCIVRDEVLWLWHQDFFDFHIRRIFVNNSDDLVGKEAFVTGVFHLLPPLGEFFMMDLGRLFMDVSLVILKSKLLVKDPTALACAF